MSAYAGIPTVEINPVDTRVRAGAAEAMAGIWRDLRAAMD